MEFQEDTSTNLDENGQESTTSLVASDDKADFSNITKGVNLECSVLSDDNKGCETFSNAHNTTDMSLIENNDNSSESGTKIVDELVPPTTEKTNELLCEKPAIDVHSDEVDKIDVNNSLSEDCNQRTETDSEEVTSKLQDDEDSLSNCNRSDTNDKMEYALTSDDCSNYNDVEKRLESMFQDVDEPMEVVSSEERELRRVRQEVADINEVLSEEVDEVTAIVCEETDKTDKSHEMVDDSMDLCRELDESMDATSQEVEETKESLIGERTESPPQEQDEPKEAESQDAHESAESSCDGASEPKETISEEIPEPMEAPSCEVDACKENTPQEIPAEESVSVNEDETKESVSQEKTNLEENVLDQSNKEIEEHSEATSTASDNLSNCEKSINESSETDKMETSVEVLDKSIVEESQLQEEKSISLDDSNSKESSVDTDSTSSDTNKDLNNSIKISNIESTSSNNVINNDSCENERTEFVHVIDDKDDQEKEDPSKEDPIGADPIEIGADSAGSSAELDTECIIPDTERVISQEEKDAASTMTPLIELSPEPVKGGESSSIGSESDTPSIEISKCTLEEPQACAKCVLQRVCKYSFKRDDKTEYLCDDSCLENFRTDNPLKVVLNFQGEIRVKKFGTNSSASNTSYIRKCSTCSSSIEDPETNLCWEIMDFCNDVCLSKYQQQIGSNCFKCSAVVANNHIGKYCVRFGTKLKQFCTISCLESYKKGLKLCSYCHQDMSSAKEGFLAPVGDKGSYKDFCSHLCMDKYNIMTKNIPPKVAPGTQCSVCQTDNRITIEFDYMDKSNYFCSDRCFVAFSFVNNIKTGRCGVCRRNFLSDILDQNSMFYDNIQYNFCSTTCRNIHIIAHRKIMPCSWCKVKKYNFDMIRRYSRTGTVLNMCSVTCFKSFQESIKALNVQENFCDMCRKNVQPRYHLTTTDGSMRNFCTYSCIMAFQKKPVKAPAKPQRMPPPPPPVKKTIKRDKPPVVQVLRRRQAQRKVAEPTLPVISSVHSLASTNGPEAPALMTRSKRLKNKMAPPPAPPAPPTPPAPPANKAVPLNEIMKDMAVHVKQHVIVKPTPLPEQRNVSTMCRIRTSNKGSQAVPKTQNAQTQTTKRQADKILIPVPIPIYVPLPMHMFTAPVPMPVPIPIPVPVPIFIPTTRNSANGIMKEIKKIQVKIPTDPYEAELLMMAEMVADDKKEDHTDSESDVDDTGNDDGGFSPDPQDSTNAFGDDMLQMALKMATELDEPAVDLEGALTANTITASQGTETVPEHVEEEPTDPHSINSMRGRKRVVRGSRSQAPSKRGRRNMSTHVEIPIMPIQQQPPPPDTIEKPDANMCLKYTFGVNAWKQWVTFKNAELEKSSRRMKLFKTEILQLTTDELNYSLCLFVKEVRKPNGTEYAPDTIYYLCLGIQQYLFENGRIDNIFCDAYYEKFTDCLDEVARRFSVLYNDSHYIVTRVEEEHLWESKQLGAHSPHVLLSTLMFFNTKHFNLTTVDEHMQLSFSHIMKHWKRNPNQPGASKIPGSRNVLLRFYPPQAAIQNNARKKKVYEQQENEDNPLRCPVKLYEFYLSKCPESVKTRNDVFYLLPERSCVPDSPVWYSTTPLPKEALEKMLHRVKMVKEINVALLTS